MRSGFGRSRSLPLAARVPAKLPDSLMGKVLAIALVVATTSGFPQSGGLCGVERWSVKIMTDRDASLVSLVPQPTTIPTLRALAMPEELYPNRARMPPHELKTYVLRGRLVERRLEADQDLHLVLADPTQADATLIVEIPAAVCAIGSPLVGLLDEARKQAQSIPLGGGVEVVGIGFFDFIHNASGQAPNGFELHPVFRVTARPLPRQITRGAR